MSARMRVKIRRGPGWRVRPEAEKVDGKVYTMVLAWELTSDSRYPGDRVWMPRDKDYPSDAPIWIAEGDLERVDDNEEGA